MCQIYTYIYSTIEVLPFDIYMEYISHICLFPETSLILLYMVGVYITCVSLCILDIAHTQRIIFVLSGMLCMVCMLCTVFIRIARPPFDVYKLLEIISLVPHVWIWFRHARGSLILMLAYMCFIYFIGPRAVYIIYSTKTNFNGR